MRTLLAAIVVLFSTACGSTPAGSGADGGLPGGGDGGAPVGQDGGTPGGEDGGTPGPDGGPILVDGGSATPRILPGLGLDVPVGGGIAALRIGQTRAQVKVLVGDGQDSSFFPGNLDRSYDNGGYFLLFGNADGSNDGATPSPQPTLTDPDLVRYLVAGPTFPGKTVGGAGPGSPRATWLGELASPEATLISLDDPAQTTDYYFGRGLGVVYATNGGTATAFVVARVSRKPDLNIQLRERRVGDVQARLGTNGSAVSAVRQDWGEPDQIDTYQIFDVIPGANFQYLWLGLTFITQAAVGSQEFHVTGVLFFDPYFGKTDFGELALRSLKADFDAKLSSSTCPPLSRSQFGRQWTVYRWSDGHCDARLGVGFDEQDRARFLYLNFP
jgi:hypothetical protein